MNPTDLKNNSLIEELVKKYFSYSKKSFDMFSKALSGDRVIPDEFKKLLKDSPDGRIRFKTPILTNEHLDQGWVIWKSVYSLFYDRNRISYKDFFENRIKTENGSERKITKVITSWYKENSTEFIRQIGTNLTEFIFTFLEYSKTSRETFFSMVLEKEENIKAAAETCHSIKILGNGEKYKVKFSVKKGSKDFALSISLDKFKGISIFSDLINFYILRSNEKIGKVASPKKSNLELVFSVNFADWFLCSTAERWGSCLSLTSAYSNAYWTGLPSTIVDPNRALIYLTDGAKKEYRGIEVDRFISRSWVILIDSDSDKTTLHLVNEYPGSFSLFKIAKEIFKDLGVEALGYGEMRRPSHSKYSFPLLFYANGTSRPSASIFQDTSILKLEDSKQGLVRHRFGERGGSHFIYRMGTVRETDDSPVYMEPEFRGSDDDDDDDDDDSHGGEQGLDYLITHGLSVKDFM